MRNPSSPHSLLKARLAPPRPRSRALVSIDLLSLGALLGLLVTFAIPASHSLLGRIGPSRDDNVSQALSAYHAQCHPQALTRASEEKLMDLLLRDLLLALEAERKASAPVAGVGSAPLPPPVLEP